MPTYKIKGTNDSVELTQNDFLAAGGEGSVYVKGDTVYKICESGKMIPEEKIKELSKLKHKHIIVPDKILTYRNKSEGYTMRRVPGNAMPLAQILPKPYREREGVTPDEIKNIVQQISEAIRFIHSHPGYLQVDGNEFNYMVTEDYKDVYFIDVNSYQTPSFPADAIMLSIRDWHCPQHNGLHVWSQLSDWYSFAIISFWAFTGMHPFKGRHSSFPNMKTFWIDQMKASKSVLDPEMTYPLGAIYHPFENFIPGGKDGAFMQWYRALFIENKRLQPPKDFQSIIAAIQTIKEIVGSNNFNIKEIQSYNFPIIGYYENDGQEVVVTKKALFLNGKSHAVPIQRMRIGFTPTNKTTVMYLNGDEVYLYDLKSEEQIKINLRGKDIMSCEGRLYVQGEDNIFEINYVESANLAVGRNVASIMPNATTMYQGVAVQDIMGTLMVSIFPASNSHKQYHIKEIAGYRIIDAKYENGVLMMVGHKNSQYDRFVVRFNGLDYDIRVVDNITPAGLNFKVLPNGTCVCITEEEKIEVFSNQVGSGTIKSFKDPAIDGDMHLTRSGNQIRFAKGSKLYSFSMK